MSDAPPGLDGEYLDEARRVIAEELANGGPLEDELDAATAVIDGLQRRGWALVDKTRSESASPEAVRLREQRAQFSFEAPAAALLKGVVDHDDEMGHLANATADELRDALRLAAKRLRGPSRDVLVAGARWLVAEVWWLVQEQRIDARSRAADAALDLRDCIDPHWWPEHEKEDPRLRPGVAEGESSR